MADTRLVLVAGLDREATGVVAKQLRRDEPGTALVHHDLSAIGEGVVHRRLWQGGTETSTVLELAHGCVSCTLREDLLPLLCTLITHPAVARIVVHLDPSMEPEPVCARLARALVGDHTITELATIEAVLTVLDEGSWLTDATGDEDLIEVGGKDFGVAPDDDRTLAQIAVSQVQFADALVITGRADDGWAAARTAAVLDRLAPSAPRGHLAGVDLSTLLAAIPAHARRGEVGDAHGPLLFGAPPLEPECGVALTVFTNLRPFHPHRLHDAIDVLLDGVVRARGRVWVASQPDVVLWLESAGGGLRVGHAGAWLAALDDQAWERATPQRRTKAALDWHPRYGDRRQELVILSHLASPDAITAALGDALLTDDELAAGADTWRHYPDPFGDWHTDPCTDTPADAGTTATSDHRKDHA